MLVAEYLEFLLSSAFPLTLNLLNSFEIIPGAGVTWLGLSVAVTLLSCFIGSILMRV